MYNSVALNTFLVLCVYVLSDYKRYTNIYFTDEQVRTSLVLQ